ncbi:MAG TPA: cytochrome c [Longimicrobiaceae bacterium]|nr:cytochrome c [Longimicrobiaceae bacterium]
MTRRIRPAGLATWMLPSLCLTALAFLAPGTSPAQQGAMADVTFARDIAPILQRSCQSCHRPGGVAPMSLVTYDEVRPWAQVIRHKTSIRDRAGAMPPWYIEKDIGIQHYKNDPSLSDEELATIAMWADNGAPQGNPADMPPPVAWGDDTAWTIGQPDLVLRSGEIFVEGGAPDWWGEIESIPTGLTEDRYVAAVEIKEINDVGTGGEGRETVGGRFIVHHMIWRTEAYDEDGQVRGRVGWPVHEVGRNPDVFDPEGGRLLKAGSSVVSESVHLHSNGRDTKANLLIAFKFHPKGYEPKYRSLGLGLGNGMDIDIKGNEAGQQLHAYVVLPEHTKIISFEPHLHAPGMRMCLEAIWGINIETLTCAGYDHNWVRGYTYEDGYQPLLPKGTILHIIGYMDNSETNPNVPDPRNWQGSGNRSVTNMFIDLGMRVALTEEDFIREMKERQERFELTRNDHVIGCPLCTATLAVPDPTTGPTND